MHTCEEMQAPVIIAIHPDELEFVEDSFVKAVIESGIVIDSSEEQPAKAWCPIDLRFPLASRSIFLKFDEFSNA